MIRVRLGLSIAMLLVGCGGSGKSEPVEPNEGMTEQTPPTEPTPPAQPTEPAQQPAQPAPPAPKKLTTEELIKAHDACYAAWLAKDEKKVTDCYTASSTEEMVDSSMPAAQGPQGSLEHSKNLWAGFPDLSGSTIMNIGNGNTVVHIGVLTGTNTGEMMGQKPTGKKMGMIFAEVIEMSDDGKHDHVRIYTDMGTMAGQLGMAKGKKVRPVMEKTAGEPKVAIATDSEDERKNVSAVTAGFEAFNKKDWKALEAAYAPDAVFSDNAMPADVKGAKNIIKNHQAILKAFTDGKANADKIWGAGEFVVAEETFTGTNDGAWPQAGIKKKTGKPVTTHAIHVFQVAGGKVKQHWVFENGMALAMQLGLMPPPGAKPEKGEKMGAEPATPATPPAKK